eukprot:9397383-Pyramimonas_sp.AAC.2
MSETRPSPVHSADHTSTCNAAATPTPKVARNCLCAFSRPSCVSRPNGGRVALFGLPSLTFASSAERGESPAQAVLRACHFALLHYYDSQTLLRAKPEDKLARAGVKFRQRRGGMCQ